MRHGQQLRRITSRSSHRVRRLVLRHRLRSAPRVVIRHVIRRVFPDDCPSLNAICNVISRYIKLTKAYDKKWGNTSGFNTGQNRETYRNMDADLDFVYNGDLPAQPKPLQKAKCSPPADPPLKKKQTLPDKHRIPSSAPRPTDTKHDLMAVPLVHLPNGLLGLDWSKAKPAE